MRDADSQVLAHILDLAPAMVCDLSGTILSWGRGMQRAYGWTAVEAIGAKAFALLRTEFPQSFAALRDEVEENGEWQGELTRSRRDGEEMSVASIWSLHRDSAGAPISILMLDWDLTETKRVQAMVAEREARLRLILETSPNAIITIDDRGVIQSFSDAAEKMFGYAEGEVVGRNVSLLMPSPNREKHDGYLQSYLATGIRKIIGIGREVEALKKDGTIFPMELAVGQVEVGGVRVFTGFIRDLTQRNRLEQELRQAQKMEAIGQLTGGIAHDFNNLLTVISGNLEMLERRLREGEDVEILKEAQEATQLGAELSRRLLAFGRRQSLQPRLIDLNALAGRMIDLLRRSLGEQIRIETRLAPALPSVLADPGMIENALLNLSVNARDAMPKGGMLMVETGLSQIDADYAAAVGDLIPGRFVTLSVTDTGTGMSKEVLRRAIEPFFTTKGSGAGTGLGLSMVYGFAKQSGGHLQIYSELGHGTTVRLYLPAREDEGEEAASKPEAAARHEARGRTILVVEDDARVRKVSIRRLDELGYKVIAAENGPAALEILRSPKAIDLMFTDVVMPGGMTGVELAEECRKLRPDLPILFTSGFTEPTAQESGLEKERSGWLGKPYSLAELDTKLQELLKS